MAENALAPEQKLPKAPPVLPDDEVLYELAASAATARPFTMHWTMTMCAASSPWAWTTSKSDAPQNAASSAAPGGGAGI